MARLRVKVELNKGRVGIPLRKLHQVVEETERFLRMLAEDAGIDPEQGQWLGLDFESGSLKFNAEYIGKVIQKTVRSFNTAFDDVRRGKPVQRVRVATRYQYAKIAEALDEDEVIGFGTYKSEDETTPEIFTLAKRDLPALLGEVQVPVESHGSVQGVIHSLFLGSQPPHFFLRELATGNLVKCVYERARYDEVAHALQQQNAVVHVYGEIKIDIGQRAFQQLRMERIVPAEPMSESDFESFFGCAPNLTGQLSTQQFIDKVRGRAE